MRSGTTFRGIVLAGLLTTVGCEPSTCSDNAYSLGYPCPHNLDRTLTIDESFSLDEQAAIVEAVAIWTEARPRVAWSAIIGKVETGQDGGIRALDPSEPGDKRWGRAWTRNAYIQIKPGLSYDKTLHTAMHELGHLTGLDHGPSGTLMAPCWEGHATGLDAYTLNDFDTLYDGI